MFGGSLACFGGFVLLDGIDKLVGNFGSGQGLVFNTDSEKHFSELSSREVHEFLSKDACHGVDDVLECNKFGLDSCTKIVFSRLDLEGNWSWSVDASERRMLFEGWLFGGKVFEKIGALGR
jgi:hypothetical protein